MGMPITFTFWHALQELSDVLVLHPCLVGDGSGGLGDLLNVVALEDDLVLDVGERDLGALEHGAVTDDLLADCIPSVSEDQATSGRRHDDIMG
jgi:hypothetical protein